MIANSPWRYFKSIWCRFTWARHPHKKAVFEAISPKNLKNGYAVFAGLERIVNHLKNLHFSESDIAYLESLGCLVVSWITWKFQMELTVRSKKGTPSLCQWAVQVEGPPFSVSWSKRPPQYCQFPTWLPRRSNQGCDRRRTLSSELVEQEMRLFREPVQPLLEAC